MIWLPAGQPEAEHKESTADFISTLVFKPECVFSTNNPLSYIHPSDFNSTLKTEMFLFSNFYSVGHQTQGNSKEGFLSERRVSHSPYAHI